MNNETSNENFSTPLQTKSKRLGLRRNNSGSVNKESAATTTTPLRRSSRRMFSHPSEQQQNERENNISDLDNTQITPLTQSIKRKLRSDIKINYRNLEIATTSNGLSSPPATPEFNLSGSLQRDCLTTNCRPYRLALSKRVREKMTKKRLEFHIANEMEKEEDQLESECRQENADHERAENTQKQSSGITEMEENKVELTHEEHDSSVQKDTTNKPIPLENNKSPVCCDELNEQERKFLVAKIEKMHGELKSRNMHINKVQELQQAINVWKNGLSAALRDLQEKITPHYDYEDLLEHLKIPKEILKHIND